MQIDASDHELTENERWYVVRALPNCETKAFANLNRQGFRAFMPARNKAVRHARQIRVVRAPIFPSYLFSILDLERDRWRSVNTTVGVAGLITADDRPVPVPHGIIEALIRQFDERYSGQSGEGLRPGQKVRLLAGPFAEALGILERLDGPERVAVLLRIMGGEIKTSVRRERVEAVV
jgi:transcription elongation factor/antiterminator RfaH